MKLYFEVRIPKFELKFFLVFVVLYSLVMRLLKIGTSGKWSLFVLQATGSYKIFKYYNTYTIPLWVSLHDGRKCPANTCRVGTFHVTVTWTSNMSTGHTIDRYQFQEPCRLARKQQNTWNGYRCPLALGLSIDYHTVITNCFDQPSSLML